MVQYDDIDWSKTTMYHLDEYVGISENHKASFRKYIKDNFLSKINNQGKVHLIDGNNNPSDECKRLNNIINKEAKIDVSFVGIGENGHLAFNEPPANFEEENPFVIVELDKVSRQQQVKEGWFESINDVPKKAITMTIKQIMISENIICTVPGERKAKAVKNCLGNNKISPEYPSSILKNHNNAYVFLDKNSASLIIE